MRTRDLVNDFLKELGQKSGHQFALDENGSCALSWQGGWVCFVSTLNDYPVVIFSAPVFDQPNDEQRGAFYEALLDYELLGARTSGASFALDRPNRRILLWYSHSTDHMDSRLFEAILSDFLHAAERIKKEISEELARSEGSSPRTEFPTEPMIRA